MDCIKVWYDIPLNSIIFIKLLESKYYITKILKRWNWHYKYNQNNTNDFKEKMNLKDNINCWYQAVSELAYRGTQQKLKNFEWNNFERERLYDYAHWSWSCFNPSSVTLMQWRYAADIFSMQHAPTPAHRCEMGNVFHVIT